MGKLIDLTGQTFGRLTVVEKALSKPSSRQTKAYWVCRCECGAISRVNAYDLRHGRILSCGCHRRDVTKQRNTTHGLTGSPEHHVWKSMMRRCLNQNDHTYSRYGGRGISVCPRWLKFENFLQDMGSRPSPDHSLDRIDNSGSYCLENCRWATKQEQNNNKRNNIVITYQGKTLTLKQWSRELGISYSTLQTRVYKGWPPEKALSTRVVR